MNDDATSREGGADDELVVPPLGERVRGVLTAPGATFARHQAAWGWAGPWLLVALLGLAHGVLVLATVDLDALAEDEWERALDHMSPAQRAMVEEGEAAERVAQFRRLGLFAARLWLVVGPPIGGLTALLFAGIAVYLVAWGLGAAPGRRDLVRCLSLSAHAQLVLGLGTLAAAVGTLSGNPIPRTSLAALVDPFAAPVLAAALGRLDPVLLLYYGVLMAGLRGSCRLSAVRAGIGAGGLYLAASVWAVAGAALGALMQGMGGS